MKPLTMRTERNLGHFFYLLTWVVALVVSVWLAVSR
jgi:hypothetical protein